MSRANRLLALQEIDSQRDRCRTKLAKIAAALRVNAAVERAKREVAEAQAVASDVEPRFRDASRAREEAKAHLDREQAKLYSGAIRSPKELQGFQRETQALQRRLGELDDTVLELMLARDDAERRLRVARDALGAAEDKAAAESRALQRQQAQLTDEMRDLDARRQHAVSAVEVADMQVYERLRASKGGQAVSPLHSDICDACGMQLPRLLADKVEDSNGLVTCPSCGRILAS
jgi:predicted  nucleic acid-binding Zn-ribbon protein